MSRTRPPRRNRLSPEIEELNQLARALADSSSRIEDGFWESRLAAHVDRMLRSGDDEGLNSALDSLNQTDPRACDALADTIESRCESEQGESDMLMFAAPILAWSRYAIPSGAIPADAMANLRVQLGAHVLAAGTKVGLADVLYSPDQLPNGFGDTLRFRERLTKAALHGRDLHVDPRQLGETMSFLSDTRYLVGVVVAGKGAPLFRWQESDGQHADSLAHWRAQGGEALRPLLPACASELLLPLAYHSACREADRQSRPYSIRASVAFLSTAVNLGPGQLGAVIALFRENRTEEFRIGFSAKGSSDVVHGVTWPMLDAEDVHDAPARIETVLRECGIDAIRLIEHDFPLEYCDDCGVPLYPNNDDEAVHAELPEDDSDRPPQHLH